MTTKTKIATTTLEKTLNVSSVITADENKQLLSTFKNEVESGHIHWEKNVIQSLNSAINRIDQMLSSQLSIIMHHPTFNELEGAWQGLHSFVKQAETSRQLKIKVLNATKQELHQDLDRAVDFDQSQLFKKVYEEEFGTPGGEPYSILLGDYQFDNSDQDISTLSHLSHIAAAGFCPFISAASSQFMGLNSWSELSKPRDLEKIFDNVAYAKWRSFRESDDSRFVVLTLPRVLARLPYGQHTKPTDSFKFEEAKDQFCWKNTAYALANKLTDAFNQYGWCTAIRGAEGGGKVENLPLYTFLSDKGDIDAQCPTEVGITDRREAELGKLGFLPLCHYKNTDYAVFFGADTTQKPKHYDDPQATANAKISARLPYIMATSRFSHYLKVMSRDKVGSFLEAEEAERWLNTWIQKYVNANMKAGQAFKAQFPLAEAKIEVQAHPGKPGAYQAIAWLRPWLQLEELTASLRLVAEIPTTQ